MGKKVFEVTIRMEVEHYNHRLIKTAIRNAINDNDEHWSNMLECDAEVTVEEIKDMGGYA